MKNILNTTVVLVSLFAFTMASCDDSPSTAEPIDPGNYPTATLTTDFQGNTVTEGDTIWYNLSTDKPLETAVTFEVSVTGDNVEAHDYGHTSMEFPAFADTTLKFPVAFPVDDIPEETKELTYTIEVPSIGTKYTLNPDTEFPTKTVTVKNKNNPDALTVALEWENHDSDIDMWLNLVDDGTYSGYDGDGDGLVLWGDAASADNPEILTIPTNDISENGASGNYYVEFDPYEVAGSTVKYKFAVGHPDQSVEYFEGTFDTENLASYTADNLDYSYDASNVWSVYRMLEVTLNASGEFTVTSTN